MARSSTFLLLLALITPILYERYLAFSNVFANRPSAFKPLNTFKSHSIKFQDRIRNCEDVVLIEDKGLAILSCDPGRDRWNTVMGYMNTSSSSWTNGGLWLYDYSNPDLPDSEALRPLTLVNFPNINNFHPLGIEYDAASSTLYVVNHAFSSSLIEIFTLETKTASARHVRTMQHSLIHAPNSIHTLGDGKLFITNDHYFYAREYPALGRVETWLALPLASVIFVDTNDVDRSVKTVARLPFANGVTMVNETMLAVASSSRPGVYFYTVDPTTHSLLYEKYIRAPAVVDNLAVDGNGKLLMAGHPFAPALLNVFHRRKGCVMGSENEEEKRSCECDAPSWAAEWSEEEGLREVYRGKEICTSSMFVRDVGRGLVVVSGIYDRGVLVGRL